MRSFADAISQQPSVRRAINTTGGGKTSFESRHLCTQTKIYILNIAAPRPGSLSVYKSCCCVYVGSQQPLKRPPGDCERPQFWVAKCPSLGHHPLSAWKVIWDCGYQHDLPAQRAVLYSGVKMVFLWPESHGTQMWSISSSNTQFGFYSLKLVQRRDFEEVQPQSLSPWTSVPAGSAQQLSSPRGRVWSSTPCPDLHLHGGGV